MSLLHWRQCAHQTGVSILLLTLVLNLLEHAEFDLDPLPSGYVYAGPPTEFANSCRCSSVYYSMLSACGYCQGRSFKK